MSRRATGFRAWVLQRATALYLMLWLPYLMIHFLFFPPADLETWRSWIAQPIISITLAIGLYSIILHAWVGLRDIYIDYIKLLSLRLTLLMGTAFGLVACAIWGTQLIFMTRV